MITAIVLAAGRSSRMGKLKQLLPFGDITIIERVLNALLASRIDHVSVVLGHRADEIRRQIDHYPVNLVTNPDVEGEMLSSVQCGVQAISDRSDVLVALSDQPFISPRVVNILIETHDRERAGFVIPTYDGKRGHPLIIDARYRDELLALRPPDNLKQFRDRHADALVMVPVDTEEVLIDLDYYKDYQQALEKLKEE